MLLPLPQNGTLDRIVRETGRSKNDILRESVAILNAHIGTAKKAGHTGAIDDLLYPS